MKKEVELAESSWRTTKYLPKQFLECIHFYLHCYHPGQNHFHPPLIYHNYLLTSSRPDLPLPADNLLLPDWSSSREDDFMSSSYLKASCHTQSKIQMSSHNIKISKWCGPYLCDTISKYPPSLLKIPQKLIPYYRL